MNTNLEKVLKRLGTLALVVAIVALHFSPQRQEAYDQLRSNAKWIGAAYFVGFVILVVGTAMMAGSIGLRGNPLKMPSRIWALIKSESSPDNDEFFLAGLETKVFRYGYLLSIVGAGADLGALWLGAGLTLPLQSLVLASIYLGMDLVFVVWLRVAIIKWRNRLRIRVATNSV